MRSMMKRLEALEMGNGTDLSPAVKAWLGWPVTDAEREAIDRGDYEPVGKPDTSTWSKEARIWLGVE